MFDSDAPWRILIFLVRVRTSQNLQRHEELIVACTTSGLVPLGITDNICQSPPKTTTLPPNGICLFRPFTNLRISLKDRSTASKQCLCIIGASSQIKSLAFAINVANGEFGSMVHV